MNIIICDDEKNFVDSLYLQVQGYMEKRYIPCTITATDDPVTILQSNKIFDLAFLDIQMPGADGLMLARELRKRNPKLALFFVTNFDEYQDDAMDLQAFRFFKKPFNIQRLHAGLDKAMEYIDGAYVDVFFSSNSQQEKILVDDIIYITRADRKILMVSKHGSFYTRDMPSAELTVCKSVTCKMLPLDKGHFITEVNYSGESFGIYIPCYELPIFEELIQ